MSGHDQRCEWSAAPPKRCRCTCEGRLHGIARVRQAVVGSGDQSQENQP